VPPHADPGKLRRLNQKLTTLSPVVTVRAEASSDHEQQPITLYARYGVKVRRTQHEHMSSGLPDIARCNWHICMDRPCVASRI